MLDLTPRALGRAGGAGGELDIDRIVELQNDQRLAVAVARRDRRQMGPDGHPDKRHVVGAVHIA